MHFLFFCFCRREMAFRGWMGKERSAEGNGTKRQCFLLLSPPLFSFSFLSSSLECFCNVLLLSSASRVQVGRGRLVTNASPLPFAFALQFPQKRMRDGGEECLLLVLRSVCLAFTRNTCLSSLSSLPFFSHHLVPQLLIDPTSSPSHPPHIHTSHPHTHHTSLHHPPP